MIYKFKSDTTRVLDTFEQTIVLDDRTLFFTGKKGDSVCQWSKSYANEPEKNSAGELKTKPLLKFICDLVKLLWVFYVTEQPE